MPTGYQIIEQDKAYFVTLQVVDWVDVFSREVYRKIIVENLCYCIAHKGLEIYAWVVMSNHVHLMFRSKAAELSNTLREFKSFTAKIILNEMNNCQESRKEWMFRQFKSATIRHKRNAAYQFWTVKIMLNIYGVLILKDDFLLRHSSFELIKIMSNVEVVVFFDLWEIV
jgi:REP element-mobilizing transposase RayT